MQRQRTIVMLSAGMMLLALLSFGLLALPTAPALAIGEVTPTPAAVPNLTFDEYVEQGAQAFQNGDFRTAIDHFSQALLIQPDADVYFLRGFAYSELQDYQASINDYTSSLELRPYDWTALNNRGFNRATLGDFDGAIADFDQSIYRNPRYQVVFVNLSDIYNQLGRNDEALVMDWIARGLERSDFQDDVTAIEYFGNAIEEMNRIEGGQLSLEQQSAVYYNRGLMHHGREDWTEAIADYTAALQIFPTMHDSFLARGIAYRESGDLVRSGEDFIRRMDLLQTRRFPIEALTIGVTREVEMAYGYVYEFSFEVTAGRVLKIEADDADGSGVDPLIVLLGPDGRSLAGDDDFGGNLDAEIAEFTVPQDGIYTVRVSHANGAFDGLVRVLIDDFVPDGSF